MTKATDEPTQPENAPSLDTPGREAELTVVCPVCGSSKIRLRKSYSVPAVSALWRDDFKMEVSNEFHGYSEFHLYRCSHCSLLFFAPSNLAGSAALYEQLENQENYYASEKWEHTVALEDLRGSTIALEIGCGFGSFVARGRSEGISQLEGIELNPSAVKVAVGQGLPVRALDLDAVAAQSPGKYDAVCAFQVLEHVPNPKEFLSAACAVLHAGGKLVVGVPNAASFLRFIDPFLLDMPPHHMTRWSPEALRNLTRTLPLRLERIVFEPLADYHVEMYFEAQGRRIVGRHMKARPFQKLRAVLARLVKIAGINPALRGHTVYACYSKI